jgi:predicted glycosyltransferase
MIGENGMRQSSVSPRIAVFTHDTFGLGHVRRCMHITRSLAREAPDAAIMFVTGSPALHMFSDLPRNADFVKIPTIAKTGTKGSRPSHLPIAQAELVQLRKTMIRHAIVTFAPDVLLVDNFPLGAQNELLDTLQDLRRQQTRMILGLRDVLDAPDTVQADWERQGMYEVLERYYDRILVYGMEAVLDVRSAYRMPARLAERVHYCGYVADAAEPSRSSADIRSGFGLGSPLVLVTGGGGGDAFPLLKLSLQALESMPDASALLVTGPLMGRADRDELEVLARGRTNIRIVDYVKDLPSYLLAADLVVSMCGYNTAAEIASRGIRAIVVPRTWRYGEHLNRARTSTEWEQLLRAQAFSELGLVRLLEPEAANAQSLAAAMRETLASPTPAPRTQLDLDGIGTATRHILDLAGQMTEAA